MKVVEEVYYITIKDLVNDVNDVEDKIDKRVIVDKI